MSQPFGTPPPVAKKRNIWPIVIGVCVVGALLLFAACSVGSFLFLGKIREIEGLSKGKPAVPKFAESAWGERTIDEIRVEAPCQFGPGPNVSGELPENVRALIDSMKTYQSLGTPENFIVMASSVAYSPQIQASLDGAVQGTVTEAAARLGDMNPKFDAQPIEVSGIEGRRSIYKRAVEGQTMHLETVTVCKENRLWQVQVIYTDAESKAFADRILKSVEIAD